MTEDMVNHPKHYTAYAREVIDLTSLLDFTLGNAVKYILRAPFKGNFEQDMKKAVWYLNHEHTRLRSLVPEKAIYVVLDYEHPLVTKLIMAFPSRRDGECRKSVIAVIDEVIAEIEASLQAVSK